MQLIHLDSFETEIDVGSLGHIVIHQTDKEDNPHFIALTPVQAEQLLSLLPDLIQEAKETFEEMEGNNG